MTVYNIEKVKPPPKKRGIKPGTILGPRVGSRPWHLLNLSVGQSFYVEVEKDMASTMGHLSNNIFHNGLQGKIELQALLAIHPKTREVIELVRALRVKE